MPVFDIICLAKSRRPGGRCIAGLRTDGGGWVRPIAPGRNGALLRRHYILSDGSEIEVLDVVKVRLSGPQPELYQPENWIIGEENWELEVRPATSEYLQILWNHIQRGPTLFRNKTDRVHIRSFQERAAESSLALIIPDRVEWEITEAITGRRQTRCYFRLRDTNYNLVVTDPVWEHKLNRLPLGSYGSESIGCSRDEKFLLTISLGEPFNDNYSYKLVAWAKPLSELEALQQGRQTNRRGRS
jgi:hypothetical protein